MSHRCDVPSKYSLQFVFGGFRCRVCGQRWVNLPDGAYSATWTKVGWWRWFWLAHGMEVTSTAIASATVTALILIGWIPLLP